MRLRVTGILVLEDNGESGRRLARLSWNARLVWPCGYRRRGTADRGLSFRRWSEGIFRCKKCQEPRD